MLRFVIPPLGGLIIYYIGTRQFKQPGIYWMITAILFVVLWIIFYPSRHEKSIRKQVKRMLSERDNSSFFGEKTLILNGDNIEILDGSTSEKFLKNSVEDVRIYDNIIAVYLSSTNAHIIPTRYLDDEAKQFLISYFSI